MWKAFLIFSFLLPLRLAAQQLLPTDSTTGRISVSETVAMNGLTQKELHDKTITWLAKFKPPQSEIQQDKPDMIVFKGFKKVIVKTDEVNTSFPLHFMLTVRFADGSVSYKATNFSPDGINYYSHQSLKHPDEQKYKNKKDKAAYVAVYEAYGNGMQSIGKELKAAFKKPLPTTKQ